MGMHGEHADSYTIAADPVVTGCTCLRVGGRGVIL